MKKSIKQLLIIISVITASVTMFACGSAGSLGGIRENAGIHVAPGGLSKDDAGNGENENEYPAGKMTAGAHNDNLYYDLYKSLFYKGQTATENGKFEAFSENNKGLDSLNRVKVTVRSGTKPVCNAPVKFVGNNEKIFLAQTDSNGVCYIFGNVSGGAVTAKCGEYEKTVQITAEDKEIEIPLDGNREKGKVIELMFLVDVTGSMGDEINYLKAELQDVVRGISESFQGVSLRLAMLFYRDNGDNEKFAYADFLDVTDANNLKQQQSAINKQRAEGGGDYPEAVDEALELAVSKQWSENSTKIVFHLLDAPIHNGSVYENRFSAAVYKAAEKGIRICPVLASGADLLTEYIERQAAVLTGGTFAFITDHSGIGNSHYDPEIPNVVIEKLNALMIRLVKGYYTGTFERAVSYDDKEMFIIDASEVESDFIKYGAKRCYAEGDTVTIVTEKADRKVKLYVDGVFACEGEEFEDDIYKSTEGSNIFLKFTFKMPARDVKITFEYEVLSEVIE